MYIPEEQGMVPLMTRRQSPKFPPKPDPIPGDLQNENMKPVFDTIVYVSLDQSNWFGNPTNLYAYMEQLYKLLDVVRNIESHSPSYLQDYRTAAINMLYDLPDKNPPQDDQGDSWLMSDWNLKVKYLDDLMRDTFASEKEESKLNQGSSSSAEPPSRPPRLQTPPPIIDAAMLDAADGDLDLAVEKFLRDQYKKRKKRLDS